MTNLVAAEAQPIQEFFDVSQTRFQNEIAIRNESAVLKGAFSDWPLVLEGRKGTSSLFAALEGLSLETPIGVFRGKAHMNGFFSFTDDVLDFNFDRVQMTLSQLMKTLEETGSHSDYPYVYAGGVNVPQHLPAFLNNHSNKLLPPDTEQLVSIWLGNRTRVPAHWDLPRNIAVCVAGIRQFTVFPTECVPNLYIGPLERTIAGQPTSLVDFHQPDFSRFPLFEKAMARAQVATLEPGDALYLPSLWVHHVESLTDIGMLANFWWREGPPHLTTPLHTLMHGVLTLKGMPMEERQAWRVLFDHYLFENEDPVPHIPENAKGLFGDLSAEDIQRLKRFLAQRLMG